MGLFLKRDVQHAAIDDLAAFPFQHAEIELILDSSSGFRGVFERTAQHTARNSRVPIVCDARGFRHGRREVG